MDFSWFRENFSNNPRPSAASPTAIEKRINKKDIEIWLIKIKLEKLKRIIKIKVSSSNNTIKIFLFSIRIFKEIRTHKTRKRLLNFHLSWFKNKTINKNKKITISFLKLHL